MGVQSYLESIGPDYPKVAPKHAAVDNMFAGALEDMMGLAAGVILSGGDPKLVPVYMEKTLTHLSKYIKEDGFVNGFNAPTKADLVVLSHASIDPVRRYAGRWRWRMLWKVPESGEIRRK